MNKFGIQYTDKSNRLFPEKGDSSKNTSEVEAEIKEVLKKFQKGYTERNLEKIDSYFEELFIDSEDTYVLGTSTSELCIGSNHVKELIAGDWEGWGDVKIDIEKAHIDYRCEVAYFSTIGSVKYTFEHSTEKYDRYVNFIKEKAEDSELTPKEKIAFINWALTLVFHQRQEKKREYLWPMDLSGVLVKDNTKWKFTHLQFSMAKANFPDERFENSKEHRENYDKQKINFKEYKNNKITEEVKALLKTLETKFVGEKDISKELAEEYFGKDSVCYIISPENQWYDGIDQIGEFFQSCGESCLSLDLEGAIASESGEVTWVTAIGTLKQELTENNLAEGALEELGDLFHSELTSEEKLFAAHRSIAYALKEGAAGANYTCPIRLTALILKGNDGPVFHHIHFSYPFYWILEGKLDGV